MRTISLAGVLALALLGSGSGCGKDVGGGDDDGGGDDAPPTPEDAWRIDVDVSGLDRFVPLGTETWTVAGSVTASEGVAGVDVADAAVAADGGAFSADVTVAPGLTVVPIVARDLAGNERQAHRTLLSARWLAEGAPNPDGAGLILTDAILASMGEGLAGEAAAVDVAAEILARDVLSQDDRCVTWPVHAEQGEVAVELVRDGAALWLNIRIPDLYVYFEGQCQGLLSIIPIAGEMAGTIDLWTQLDADPAGESGCVTSFAHSTPEVFVDGWYFDVWGTSGPLQNWIIQLFSGSKSTEARQQIATELRTQADAMLAEKLADIEVFDRRSTMMLLSRPIDLHLCLSAIEALGDQLVARVAATAQGAGARVAPGAPQADGPVPTAGAGELLLDGNLVAQLLFSAWRDGGLSKANVQQVELSLIGLLVPALQEAYPGVEYVDASIDGELPPLVRAVPDVEGVDLAIEIGDLMLDLTIEGERVFRFGVRMTLLLDLVPQDGQLVPTVVSTESTAILLDEKYDGPDAALEDAVALKIGDAASSLLAGAALSLPDLPGLGAPADVTADAGGRFLRIRLD